MLKQFMSFMMLLLSFQSKIFLTIIVFIFIFLIHCLPPRFFGSKNLPPSQKSARKPLKSAKSVIFVQPNQFLASSRFRQLQAFSA